MKVNAPAAAKTLPTLKYGEACRLDQVVDRLSTLRLRREKREVHGGTAKGKSRPHEKTVGWKSEH